MPDAETIISFCRFCHAGCGIRVDVEDGRPVKVAGDPDNLVHQGFTCPKGRELPAQHNHPDRLLRSRRRLPDGTFADIHHAAALDRIAARLRQLIDRHGPRSVAAYKGTAAAVYPAGGVMMTSWMDAVGSPMMFTPRSIDQPGKFVAAALAGRWEAGPQPFEGSDVWMLIGTNPLVSMWGVDFAPHNPYRRLSDARRRGLRLIVVDPRRTETASQADLHLPVRPGEDPTLLAGMLRVILAADLVDHDFVAQNIDNLDRLRTAVEPFTPAFVEDRARVPAAYLVRAARMFAEARRGCISTGTGPDMAGRGTLTEYLVTAINVVCGRVLREGEPVTDQHVLRPGVRPRAQASPPRPASGFGERLRSRNLGMSVAGMPTAGLADEILHEGDGAVRALIVNGGNPVVAWPDQLKTIAAMRRLELLVTIDIKMSATARLAHYVIAPKLSLEVPGMTYGHENVRDYQGQSMGHPAPYAMYTPAVAAPPPGSDLVEEWEFFYGLGERLHLDLSFPGAPSPLRYDRRPTTEQLFELMCRGSRVPLGEVRKHRHGALFPDGTTVLPRDPATAARLDLGNGEMLHELRKVSAEPPPHGSDPAGRPLTHRLISRRLRTSYNSSGHDLPGLTRKGSYNAAHMNPSDCLALGVRSGDTVQISSSRASTVAVVEEADDVPPGVVSMAHAWGDVPEEDGSFRTRGSNTSRLVSNLDSVDPWSGIPRMSAVPVAVSGPATGTPARPHDRPMPRPSNDVSDVSREPLNEVS